MSLHAARASSAADHEAVRELVAGSGLPLVGLEESWRTLVLADESGLVATASLERYDDPEGPVFLLRSVAVRGDRRGEGLGRVVVQAALADGDAASYGTARTALLTETAVGWFERFGFRAVPRDALPSALGSSPELAGACPATAQAYVRP